MEKLKLKQVVIVEGKYDKIRLSSFLDSTVITTDGFSIFNNKEKCALIKRLAQQRGIIILTDSDGAGFVIRNKIKNIVDDASKIINVYIPEILGKEERKTKPSSQNLIGVEGVESGFLYNLLNKYTDDEKSDDIKKYSKADLYQLGLLGKSNSVKLRNEVCAKNSLPTGMSTNAFLECVNILHINLEMDD